MAGIPGIANDGSALAPHEGHWSSEGLTSAPHMGHFTGPASMVGGLKHMTISFLRLCRVEHYPGTISA
jgi:hypothetical protein